VEQESKIITWGCF